MVGPSPEPGFFAGFLVFSLSCLSSTQAFLLYTQLNTRWQPDHRLLLDEPCPLPEGFTWVSLAQAHLRIRPIPQPWLLAAETQGKLPAATFRLKLPCRQEEAWAGSQVSSSASWGYLCRTNVQHSPWWSWRELRPGWPQRGLARQPFYLRGLELPGTQRALWDPTEPGDTSFLHSAFLSTTPSSQPVCDQDVLIRK